MYSYRCTFPHKVQYKILAVKWAGTRLLMHFFTETTTLQVTKAGRSPGNDDEVSALNLTVFQLLYWTIGKVSKQKAV